MSILIAEDNVAQRHYLKEILEKEFPSHAPVVEAADGEETVKLALEGNYGANGVNAAQLHPTFAFVGSVKVNVFDGGRIHADAAQADVSIRQRKDELGSLDQHIDDSLGERSPC